MTLGIMQPYFFPYIGYFQLIQNVDLFIVYDNIKYTKKGWINRNRILQNGKDSNFSLPLKGNSDHLHIYQREIAETFSSQKLLNQINGSYRNAPHFQETMVLLKELLSFGDTERNLFAFLFNSIERTCRHLGIETELRVSSEVQIDHDGLKGQDKVLALCKATGTRTYINAIGGQELYKFGDFKEKGTELQFLKSKPIVYSQFENEFVPWLSIVDVMMFNSNESIRQHLQESFELIEYGGSHG